jgi:phosphoglycolate phosphatase-like HAD superfamily hydrolase
MIKAIVFDFDDTLIHTYRNGIDNLRIIGKELGLPVPEESEMRKEWGKAAKDFISNLWPGCNPADFSEKYISLSSSLKPYPPVEGVHEMLDLLSRRFVLGIVTGSERIAFSRKMVSAGLDFSKFSFILTNDEIQKSKNEAGYFDPLFRELEKLGISKKEVLFVGDSVYDYEAARAGGIHFVGVLTGPSTEEDFIRKGAERGMLIPSVTELPRLIRDNGF